MGWKGSWCAPPCWAWRRKRGGSHKRWRGRVALRSRCGLTKYAARAALAQRGSPICYNLWKFKVLSWLKIMGKRRKCSEKKKGHEKRGGGWEGKAKQLTERKDDKVKKRKMREKLDLGMPKNGQMRAGWERARPRTGHSSHSCWLTRKEKVVKSSDQELGLDPTRQRDDTTTRSDSAGFFDCESKEITRGERKWEHTCSFLPLSSVSLTCLHTHTSTLTKHSREPSVTTLSSLVLNECHDVIIQPVHCQVLGLTDLFMHYWDITGQSEAWASTQKH